MTTSEIEFLSLLAAVGVGRLLEMRLSRRHQRALAARGARRGRWGRPSSKPDCNCRTM